MIKFFRKIRQKLLIEKPLDLRAGNMSKYILYAVGEIVLVIIGILIALQINNANEQRKNKEKFTDLLEEVLEETIDNIRQTDSIKYHYDQKAILSDLVLNNDVTFEDYESNYDFFYLINVQEFQILDTGYENLIKVSDEAPIEFRKIIKELKQLYGHHKKLIDKTAIELEKVSEKYKDYTALNTTWNYQKNFAGVKPSKKIIHYFLTDSIYKNLVWEFKISAMQRLVKSAAGFHAEANELLPEFSEVLAGEHSKQIIASAYRSFEKERKELLGVYKGEWYGKEDIIKIFEENNEIYMSYGREKMPVKIYSHSEFLNYTDSYLYKISRDHNGAIQAIFYPNGTIYGSKYLKIQ